MKSRGCLGEIGAIIALNLANLRHRPLMPAITVLGFLAVVLVMVLILSVGRGLSRTLGRTGSADVALVVSSGSYSESESHLDQQSARAVSSQRDVMHTPQGPLVSPEFVTSISIAKQGSGVPADVVMRGITPAAFEIHRRVRIIAGRVFKPGVHEAIVGRQAVREYRGLKIGDTIRSGSNRWKVVGIFAAGGSLRESEIWTDLEGLQTAFHMGSAYTDIYARLTSPSTLAAFKASIAKDPRLDAAVFGERQYYTQIAHSYSTIVTSAGVSLGLLMALGAIIGAINLMFTGLSARTREIATLRAVGFRRLAVSCATLIEMTGFGLIGGIAGGAIAYIAFDGYQAGTTMGNGFSQVAFQFAVTPGLLLSAVGFALAMGLAGGVLPALRAASLPVSIALRKP